MKLPILILSLLFAVSGIAQNAPSWYQVNKYHRTPDVEPKPVKIPVQRAQRAAAAGDTVWKGPIMITEGGDYSGYFKSTDGTPVIQINTNKRVTLHDFIIEGNGDVLIQGYGGSNVYIHHGTLRGRPASDKQYGKINLWGSTSVRLENLTMDHTGGILVEKWQGTVDSPLIIRYINSTEIDKRRGNGSQGDHRAFIQLSTIFGLKNCEIAYNQNINTPDNSRGEDGINLYNVSGAEGSPIKIYRNFISGGHPFPATESSFSGAAYTSDGTPENKTPENMTGYIDLFENYATDYQNALYNIAAGHDVHFYGNRGVCASLLPSGQTSPGFWGGMCVFDGSNVGSGVFKNNYIKGNTIAYMRQGINVPFTNRQDYVVVPSSPISIQPTDNTHLPNPVTKDMERTELASFQAMLASKSITLGNAINNPVIAPTVDTLIKIPGTVQVGKSITGTITPVDSSGRAVAYKTGTVKVVADSFTSVIYGGVDEKIFQVTGLKAGTSTITVSLVNLYGETISKTVTVTVLPVLDRATSLNIQWGQE